ncbi:MAG: branched-chain amino acid ABC transporter permease [Candidatus Rokubacteria bacterium]|nr:branched-chain amino acid ABC transporter permease [Candidatus Rokubacteria bacterium]
MIVRVVAVLAIVAAALIPFVTASYGLSFTVQLLTFVILAYSWNVISGYTGYTSFGHTSFFGIGAYTSTLLTLKAGLPWPAAALAGGAVALLLALPLGVAMLRLRGSFFAIGMFGLARVFEAVAFGWSDLTQGGTGLYLPPAYDLRPVYYALLLVAVAMVALTYRLDNSRFGLQLLAIREDEDAAEALGVKTTRLKVTAFALSAIAPGACGALYAVYLSFIDPPTAFSPATELTTIAMVLFGGMGTVLGPLLGAVVLSVLYEVLWAQFPQIYLGAVGVVIAAVILIMPRGVMALVTRRGWLPAGRPTLRRIAARTPPPAEPVEA